MKALGYDGPWTMSLVDCPELTPSADHVVLDVIATGICGSDAHGYTGTTGRRTSGQIMGHEAVARVHSGGDLEPGTLVTFNPTVACGSCDFCLRGETQACPDLVIIGVAPTLNGSLAEQVRVPARNVVALSEEMPVLHGTLVEPLAVGYHAVLRGEPRPDDRVLIIGGGPIGQAAALAARRLGATSILISESSEPRRRIVGDLGFATTSPETLSDDVVSLLGGNASLVIDAVGIEATVAAAIGASTTRARIVLVGMGTSRMELRPYGLTVGERSLVGSYCYSEQDFRDTAAWVSEGHPELDLLLGRAFGLHDGGEAFRLVAEGAEPSKTLILSHTGESAA